MGYGIIIHSWRLKRMAGCGANDTLQAANVKLIMNMYIRYSFAVTRKDKLYSYMILVDMPVKNDRSRLPGA